MAEALGYQAGGIRSLRDLIRRHGRALEADLRSEYGVRLRWLFTGDMTWRELLSYVDGLPPQSRTRTALNEGRVEPTQEARVLADLFDAVSIHDWHFCAANTDEKKPQPKRPSPYPRWWIPQRPTSPRGSEQRAAKFEDARRRRQARQQAIASGHIR
ncbi:hypothetical protein [Streptomyces sp. NPDC059176]|uniref:hypothetical protein n=1 Tax=Streptomyces sp. NPDC059176 TaxID=3346758 RepID=UPI0036905FA6